MGCGKIQIQHLENKIQVQQCIKEAAAGAQPVASWNDSSSIKRIMEKPVQVVVFVLMDNQWPLKNYQNLIVFQCKLLVYIEQNLAVLLIRKKQNKTFSLADL